MTYLVTPDLPLRPLRAGPGIVTLRDGVQTFVALSSTSANIHGDYSSYAEDQTWLAGAEVPENSHEPLPLLFDAHGDGRLLHCDFVERPNDLLGFVGKFGFLLGGALLHTPPVSIGEPLRLWVTTITDVAMAVALFHTARDATTSAGRTAHERLQAKDLLQQIVTFNMTHERAFLNASIQYDGSRWVLGPANAGRKGKLTLGPPAWTLDLTTEAGRPVPVSFGGTAWVRFQVDRGETHADVVMRYVRQLTSSALRNSLTPIFRDCARTEFALRNLRAAIYLSLAAEISGRAVEARFCLECNKAFSPKRSDARYCSDSCGSNARHKRRRRRLRAAAAG